ncbi:MAG: hypothetical protein CNIPEHKO_02507 [Anaerolineales bacterium]|nr:hypothetical protein [Anaerolineales bacterium]
MFSEFCSVQLWSTDKDVPVGEWLPFQADVKGGYYGPAHPNADENGMVLFFYDHP